MGEYAVKHRSEIVLLAPISCLVTPVNTWPNSSILLSFGTSISDPGTVWRVADALASPSSGAPDALMGLASVAALLVTPVTLQRSFPPNPPVPEDFVAGGPSDGPDASVMRDMWQYDLPGSAAVSKFWSAAGDFVEFSRDKGTDLQRTLEFRFTPLSSESSSTMCSARFVVAGVENLVVGLDPAQARVLLEKVMGSELCPGLKLYPKDSTEDEIRLMTSSYSNLMMEALQNDAQMRRVKLNLPVHWKACAGFLTKDRPKRATREDCERLLSTSESGGLPADLLSLLLFQTGASSTDRKYTFRHHSCSGFRDGDKT